MAWLGVAGAKAEVLAIEWSIVYSFLSVER
jgi:hypothetical protein